MRSNLVSLGFFTTGLCCGQNQQPNPQNATTAVVRAFDTHNIVMFGEWHGLKQQYEWLVGLVGTPAFADRVDDIVVEMGNSLYQKSVDRYIAGEDIPLVQVQPAWRDLCCAGGSPPPVYEAFYRAVREANQKRRGKHQMRVVLGDPYIDWATIKDREQVGPFLGNRESWYARVVKEEVLDRKRRALLIMGFGHFLREKGPNNIEQQLRAAGASTYFIAIGTNVIGGYDDLDKRFDAWPLPTIVDLRGNWVGELPAAPVRFGGGAAFPPLDGVKFGEAADALLYVGPRDSLTVVSMPRSELEGSAYAKELDRRSLIRDGRTALLSETAERHAFQRPRASGGELPPPSPPKSMNDPLPPRPPSR